MQTGNRSENKYNKARWIPPLSIFGGLLLWEVLVRLSGYPAFILPAPSISVNGNTVAWSDHTGYAQSYLVIVDGKASVTTDTSVDAGGKLVTVQCISAHGVCGEMASSAHPTAISLNKAGVDVVRRQFFTADGRQVSRLQHGLTMIRETLADGTSRTTKVVSI